LRCSSQGKHEGEGGAPKGRPFRPLGRIDVGVAVRAITGD
jgi:hypothetical protein